MRGAQDTRAGPAGSATWDVIQAVLMAAGAFGLLTLVLSDAIVIPDTARDLLLARDCADLGLCHGIGAPASVRGLWQGALWIHLLTLVRWLGGGTVGAQALVILAQALAVGVLHLSVRRWVSRAAATPASLTLLAILVTLRDAIILWNPSALVLPVALGSALLFAVTLSGRLWYAVLAAAWLGVATDLHLQGAALLPALVVLTVASCPRPWLALPLAGLAFVAPPLLSSPSAWAANLSHEATAGRAVVLVIALTVAGLGGWAVRSRFRRQHAWVKGLTLAALVILPSVAGGAWFLALERRSFQAHYLYVGLPVAVVLAAVLVTSLAGLLRRRANRPGLARVIGGVPGVVALLAVGWASLAGFLSRQVDPGGPWTLADVEATAARATSGGHSFALLKERLQGARCWELVTGLAASTPPPPRPGTGGRDAQALLRSVAGETGPRALQAFPSRPTAASAPAPEAHPARLGEPAPRTLQVFRTVARQARPRASHDLVRVPLRHGRVAYLRAIDSWLRRDQTRVCYAPLDEGDRTRRPGPTQRPERRGPGRARLQCQPVGPDVGETQPLERFRFAWRWYPEAHRLRFGGAYRATYSIPVTATAAARRDAAPPPPTGTAAPTRVPAAGAPTGSAAPTRVPAAGAPTGTAAPTRVHVAGAPTATSVPAAGAPTATSVPAAGAPMAKAPTPRVRVVQVWDPGDPACTWQITAAPGVHGSLPARQVRMLLRPGEGGRLVVTKRFNGPGCHRMPDRRFPPCLVETRDAEAELRALIDVEKP